jgi:chromosomal replication initiator protein
MMEEQEALDLAADWADISRGLRKDLGNQLYSQWIKPIQLGSLCKQSGTLDLYLPNEFAANWVSDRFADRLSLAWKIARPDIRNVQIAVLPGRRAMPGLRLGRQRWRTAGPAGRCAGHGRRRTGFAGPGPDRA